MKLYRLICVILLSTFFSITVKGQDSLEVNINADLVNRYIWRGFDVGNAPQIQPLLTFNYKNTELGFWGTYALDKQAINTDELNLWLIYRNKFSEKISYKISVIDYYFPNGGKKLGDFSNHDHIKGTSGAHLINVGATLTGPAEFPLSFNFNINLYNDAGYNNYFELRYPFIVKEIALETFCGATTGSDKNYMYYETNSFSIINIGLTARKDLKISNSFSLPVFISCSINPRSENAFIQFGITL